MEIEARRFETGIPGFLIQGVLGPLEFHRVDGHQTSHQRCGSLGLPNCIGFPIFTHRHGGHGSAGVDAPSRRPNLETKISFNNTKGVPWGSESIIPTLSLSPDRVLELA